MSKKKVLIILGLILLALVILSDKDAKRENSKIPTPNSPGVQVPKPSAKVIPRGNRILAMHVNETPGVDFNSSLSAAQSAGVQAVGFSINWEDYEKSPKGYGADPNFLQVANAYYPTKKISLNVAIRPVDTNGYHLPSDLKGKRMNDPEVIARFNSFLEYVLNQLKDVEINYISIGNEVDIAFQKNKTEWEDFSVFLKETSATARRLRANVPVGTIISFYGLTKNNPEESKKLAGISDAIITTYYPLDPLADSVVKTSEEARLELSNFLKTYPGKQVYFAEVGMPTSEILGGSFEKQADFVKMIFEFWDENKDRIKLVAFLWLNDISKNQSKDFEKYYGISDRKFLSYLETLGLRDSSGKNKPGFEVFKAEAGARGW